MERTLTETQRETLIDRIIDGEIAANSGDGDWFLRDLLRTGCAGYNDFTNEDLIKVAEENSVEIPDA